MRPAPCVLALLVLTMTPAAWAGPPPQGMEAREVDEAAWLAEIGAKLAARHKVAPSDLRFSPGRRLVAFVQSPPPPKRKPRGRPAPRVHRVVVLTIEGRRQAVFRPTTVRGSDAPPKDLGFMDDGRLVYEVVLPPPTAAIEPPARARGKRLPAKPVPTPVPASTPPQRLIVIHPLKRRARPLRCQGTRFGFTARRDRLAYVTMAKPPKVPAMDTGAEPGTASVLVDGRKVYPRRGTTTITSDPAWSRDGLALAFLETPADAPPRLVLLADVDNPSGDTTWDLPPTVKADGLRVFWTGPGRLVVGKSPTAPVFSTSFEVERPTN